MNIRFLKTFCDIVDSGSLSKAARLNNVTQSAVSQQLAKLEEELDVPLIQRGGALASATGFCWLQPSTAPTNRAGRSVIREDFMRLSPVS